MAVPVSIQVQVTHCLNKIIQLQPKSVLDVGCGFGKWGYLCREYLDVFPGRPFKEQWTTRIDGIEFFESYIMEHQRFLYSNIMIGDVRDLCKEIDQYDLIIAGDVIEHMFKDEAEAVVETLYARANQLLMVNIPLGPGWIHPEAYGNPAELHRSEWYVEDFQPFNPEFWKFGLASGLEYGIFFCPKQVPLSKRQEGYLVATELYLNRKELDTALRYARRAYDLDPGSTMAACVVADLHIQQSRLGEAVAALEKSIAVNPAFHMGSIYLAQILKSMGERARASMTLQSLMNQNGVDEACLAQARQVLATL